MKTIKIIDLLNKIANNDEIPKKIKFDGVIYHLSKYHKDYVSDLSENVIDTNTYFINELINMDNLNDKVEIIEKEKIISVIQDYGVKMKELCETTRRIWKLIEKVEEYPIEKEKEKEIEKIGSWYEVLSTESKETQLQELNHNFNVIFDRLEQLIDAVNELRKGKSE